MTLLLDTHIFIWWAVAPNRLSSRELALCKDRANALVLSVISVWEMQIKLQLGKLRLPVPLGEIVASQREGNTLAVLPVELAHVLVLQRLPTPHKDPFDRLLIAQAIAEGAALLSRDSAFAQYPVTVLG